MLCEQKSPITVPNVPEMNMQTHEVRLGQERRALQ